MTGWLKIGRAAKLYVTLFCVSIVLVFAQLYQSVLAANPAPQSGSIGLEGTISTAPPTRGASIAIPGNGSVFTTIPINVSGLCPSGLLVKVFDNGIFVGSTICLSGSYTLQADLFSGQNILIARDFDALDQAGPDLNSVIVTYNDTQFLQHGTHISLSSDYAERGAPPDTQLTWPIQLNGGVGPFAINVSWGDESPQDLFSVTDDGTITLKHTYKTAGIYTVVVKAADKNGETALLQLVGQATGAIQKNIQADGTNVIVQKGTLILWPTVAMIPLIFVAFWIGRKYENQSLRKK